MFVTLALSATYHLFSPINEILGMYRVVTVLYTEAVRQPTIPIKKINARLTDSLQITHIKR
jgi:hypothetical protein